MTQNSNSQQEMKNQGVMFSNLFSWKGRIRRMEYVISIFVFGFLSKLIESYFLYDYDHVLLETILQCIIFIPMIFQCIKRCHDVNTSGWYSLIPFYGIILTFDKGTPGQNKYGFNPKFPLKGQKTLDGKIVGEDIDENDL